MSFKKFQLNEKIMAGVAAAGYQEPTPIQDQSIAAIIQGRDIMGLAQTGTGKTAAFVLPILQRLMSGKPRQVRALILAPTRELSEQTHEAIRELGQKTRLSSAAIYGGVSIQSQITKLRSRVDIVSACPGLMKPTACSIWDSCHNSGRFSKSFQCAVKTCYSLLLFPRKSKR